VAIRRGNHDGTRINGNPPMHPNPAFRQTPDAHSLAFVRTRAFGTLCLNAQGGPLLAHVPFLLSDDAATLDLHLVRSNPILRLGDADAVIAVAGPDAYVSPDWYGVDDQVPTWNYIAVHLRGRLTRLPDDALRDHLDRLSADQERRLLPKTPWTVAKMTPDARYRMMRQIVLLRMTLTEIAATWKLGQNKPDEVRRRAAEAVAAAPSGQEVAALSGLMRDPPR